MSLVQRLSALGAGLALALSAASAHAHDVAGTEFAFEPQEITVESGDEVEITLLNEGNLSHNITIPALDVESETIQAGNSVTVTFTAPEPGTYEIRCSVPGHANAGMTGTLTVN